MLLDIGKGRKTLKRRGCSNEGFQFWLSEHVAITGVRQQLANPFSSCFSCGLYSRPGNGRKNILHAHLTRKLYFGRTRY